MREGSEMVVFLCGLGAIERGPGLVRFLGLAVLGLLLAAATFWAIQYGGRRLSWKLFFRLSETALLFLAAALLVNGLERLEALGWLPSLRDAVWNSAWLLDDGSAAGGVVAALTGYRTQPSLTVLLACALYWAGILGCLSRPVRPPAARGA
jgi:high-affinity iron transporter